MQFRLVKFSFLLIFAATGLAHAQSSTPICTIIGNGQGLNCSGTGSSALISSGTSQAVTFSSSLTINVASGTTAVFTATSNFTLACPTNMIAGGMYAMDITQDSTGSRVATWPSCFVSPGGKSVGLVLSTTAGAEDLVSFRALSSSKAIAVVTRGLAP